MDAFSIASMSMNINQAQALTGVGTAVLSRTMDDAKVQAENTAAMLEAAPGPALERSVNPAVGGNFDASV